MVLFMLFYSTLLAAFLLLLKSQDVTAKGIQNKLMVSNNSKDGLVSSLIPLIPSIISSISDFDDEKFENDHGEPIYDINQLETFLGGSLDNRRFVTVTKMRSAGGGNFREVTYKFRTNARSKRNTIQELKKNDIDTHPKNLNQDHIDKLQMVPEGFESQTLYYHSTLRLSRLEQLMETNAELGSPCEGKSVFEPDYCELAPYPNKNIMVCNQVEDGQSKDGKDIKLKSHTCTCKFHQSIEDNHGQQTTSKLRWKQMKRGIILFKGKEVKTCLVPAYGLCDHRHFTGIRDLKNNPVYEIDPCTGHYQCDNTPYMDKLINASKCLKAQRHCTNQDFLDLFKKEVRDKVLLCSKPHPRRFAYYDSFSHYCLPEKSRDPEPWMFRLRHKPHETHEVPHDILLDR